MAGVTAARLPRESPVTDRGAVLRFRRAPQQRRGGADCARPGEGERVPDPPRDDRRPAFMNVHEQQVELVEPVPRQGCRDQPAADQPRKGSPVVGR